MALAFVAAAEPATAAVALSDPAQPARSGRTLVSDTGGWVCVGTCTYSYAWQRCVPGCATVGGGPAYLLTTADVGARIQSVVTATDLIGPASRASAMTPTIAAAPPVNVKPPGLHGTPQVGAVLTSTPGVWQDPSLGSVAFTREWLRCSSSNACVAVSTASTYVPSNADVGSFIRRSETAEGLGSATMFSRPSGPVASAPTSARAPSFTSGGSGDPAGAKARRLRPFPVVIIAGRVLRARTIIRSFVVRGPRRARVRLRCRGRGCPFARISGTIGRRKRIRIRAAQRSYRAGTVLEVRITGSNRIGKYTRLRFRKGRAPARRDLCLQPRVSRPSACS